MEADRIYSAFLRKKDVALQVKALGIGVKFGPCRAEIEQVNVAIAGRKRIGHRVIYYDFTNLTGTRLEVDSRNIVGLWKDPVQGCSTYEELWTQAHDEWHLRKSKKAIEQAANARREEEISEQKVRIQVLLAGLGILKSHRIATVKYRSRVIEVFYESKSEVGKPMSTFTALELVLRYAFAHRNEIFSEFERPDDNERL